MRIDPGKAIGVLLAGLVCLAVPSAAAEPREDKTERSDLEKRLEAEELLRVFAEKTTPERKRRDLCARVAVLGAPAVRAVEAAYRKDGLGVPQAKMLVALLGRIPAPESARALTRIARSKGLPSHWALNALGGLPVAAAHEFLLAFKPEDTDTALIKLRALEHVPGRQADEQLARALFHDDRRVSTRAKQVLARRTERGERNAAVLRDALGDARWKKPEAVPAHGIANLLAACAALPRGDGAELIADAIESDRPLIANAAVRQLAERPDLMRERSIRQTLRDYLADEPDPESLQAMLKALRQSREKEGVALAAACLERKERDVYLQACDVMTLLTGENLGRNPQTWKEWYEANGR